jgi:glycosyltransferase involved in cell wall biosynthesis
MPDKILIATFSLWNKKGRTPINGMIEPLLSFLLSKIKTVDLIDGPHPGSSRVKTGFEFYSSGKLQKQKFSFLSFLMSPLLIMNNTNSTQILFKIRDFFSVFEIVFRTKRRYDLFIGLESVYTIAGIILKKIGLVRKVAYYVSDYIPNRYSQKWLNNIYIFLDIFCCYHADYIWDVSPAFQKARIKAGLNFEKSAPVILVPNALFDKQISHLPIEKIPPFSIVFAGTFGPENGLQIAIAAMKKIVKKFPTASLNIIGGGQITTDQLRNIAKNNGVGKNIIFHGFIQNTTTLSNLVKKFAIGIAPYISFSDSPRWYGDATKIRLYLGSGLPVVTTQVPPLGKEIANIGAAIVTKDNANDLADAIINVFSNKNLYQKMREKAISYAKTNTWKNSYGNAFREMGFTDR